MKQKSKSFGYIVLLFGIALIFTGFFLLTKDENRNNIFWLNLVLACFIYFLNFVTIFGLLGIYLDFNHQIAGLGIRLISVRLYSLFSIALAVFCYTYPVDFKYQLYLQLLTLFFLAIAYFLSQISTDKAISVALEQENLSKGKQEILSLISQMEMLFTKDPTKWLDFKMRIEILKEEVRYLSPSNNSFAIELDQQMVTELNKLYELLRDGGDDEKVANLHLLRCKELTKQRKKTYSN